MTEAARPWERGTGSDDSSERKVKCSPHVQLGSILVESSLCGRVWLA